MSTPIVERIMTNTIGPKIGEVFEEALSKSDTSIAGTGRQKWLASIEQIFSKNPVSKSFMDYFKTQVEPELSAAERDAQEAHAAHLGITDPAKINTIGIPDKPIMNPARPRQVLVPSKRMVHEQVYKKHFGNNYENAAAMVSAVEHADGVRQAGLVADSFDILTKQVDHYPGWRRIARQSPQAITLAGKNYQLRPGFSSKISPTFKYNESITPTTGEQAVNEVMRFSMLGHIMLNHLSMPLLSLMRGASVVEVLKTFEDHFRSGNVNAIKDVLTKQGLFMDEFLREARELKEGRGWLSKVLNTPGFSQLRKMQLSFTGRLGGHVIEDAVNDLLKSSGSNKRASSILVSLGINPTDVLGRGSVTPEEMSKGMYRFASDVMLKYSSKDLPPAWQATMGGRMATLYKGFQFREGKFIKDQLMREFRDNGIKGVSRWMGQFITLLPLVGGVGIAATNMSVGKDPREDMDYVDALAFAGGLGVGMTTVNAARRHALTEMFAGPALGRAANLTTDLVLGQYESGLRDVIGSLGWPGRLTEGLALPTRHQIQEEEQLGDRVPTHKQHVQHFGSPEPWKKPDFIPFAPASRYKRQKIQKFGKP